MRAIGAVVAGWLAMVVVVLLLFAVGPLLLGLERVFEPGLYQATPLWIACGMAIGLLGALAGGWAAARVGRGRGPVWVLAALVLAGTIASEAKRRPDAAPGVRPQDQSVFEALAASREHAVEPLVTRVTNPLVGLLGVWIGASLALRGAQGPSRRPR